MVPASVVHLSTAKPDMDVTTKVRSHRARRRMEFLPLPLRSSTPWTPDWPATSQSESTMTGSMTPVSLANHLLLGVARGASPLPATEVRRRATSLRELAMDAEAPLYTPEGLRISDPRTSSLLAVTMAGPCLRAPPTASRANLSAPLPPQTREVAFQTCHLVRTRMMP